MCVVKSHPCFYNLKFFNILMWKIWKHKYITDISQLDKICQLLFFSQKLCTDEWQAEEKKTPGKPCSRQQAGERQCKPCTFLSTVLHDRTGPLYKNLFCVLLVLSGWDCSWCDGITEFRKHVLHECHSAVPKVRLDEVFVTLPLWIQSPMASHPLLMLSGAQLGDYTGCWEPRSSQRLDFPLFCLVC